MKKIAFILITAIMISVLTSCMMTESDTSVNSIDKNISIKTINSGEALPLSNNEDKDANVSAPVSDCYEISEFVDHVEPPHGIYFESWDSLRKAFSLKGANDDEIESFFESLGHLEEMLVYNNATLQELIDVFSEVPMLVPNDTSLIDDIQITYIPEWSVVYINYYKEKEYRYQMRVYLSDGKPTVDETEYINECLTFGNLQLKRIKKSENNSIDSRNEVTYKSQYNRCSIYFYVPDEENIPQLAVWQHLALKTITEAAE